MSLFLLATAAILLTCLGLSRISSKFGVPTLLVFIFLGMLFGSDGLVKIPFDNLALAEKICSVALIFIMFYGGFGTNWEKARPIAGKAVLLSSLGVALTAAVTGLFCHFVLRFGLLESLLIGAVTSSTDAASVFSILRSKRLSLKYNTASLLEMESGSNDPCSNILTVLVLSLMLGQAQGGQTAFMVVAQVGFGVLVGVAVAFWGARLLDRFQFTADGFDAMLVFSLALISYAAAALMGGNGYLSTYITGMILGNRPLRRKKPLVHFFDGLTGLMQILIFFLLGLLSFPSQLPAILGPALAIALFLTFVARPAAVFLLLAPFRCPFRQKLLISWAGLRGAASIVFAIYAAVSPAYTKNDVFHIVFCIVLLSISVQGSLLPLVAKKLDMIDQENDVMKTFSDYSEEIPLQFIRLRIAPGHPWAGQAVKEIPVLPDTLIVLLLRQGRELVPNGGTQILPDDEIVLCGPALTGEHFGALSELRLAKGHAGVGQTLSALRLGPGKLVILIRRQGGAIVPSGSTVLKENDVLIVNQS